MMIHFAHYSQIDGRIVSAMIAMQWRFRAHADCIFPFLVCYRRLLR